MVQSREGSFNFLRWFSLLSLASIVLITTVSAVLLSRYMTHNILMRDAVITMEFVQSIAQSENAYRFFGMDDPETISGKIEPFFRRIAAMPEVVRALVYSRDGRVIWSDAKDYVGRRFPTNPYLEEAFEGRIAVESGRTGKSPMPEHVSDKDIPFYAEIYVPIWNQTRTRVEGVVEIYKVPASLFLAIHRGNRLVWMNAGLAGLILFVVLYGIARRADGVMRLQQGRLVESETMAAIGEMSSIIAHGIRNPLASIRSSAEVALDKKQIPFFESAASDIIRDADRLENWVREILEYTRPLTGAVSPVRIDDLLRSVFESHGREMTRRGIKLALEVGPLPPVAAQETLLRHVVIGLIQNAFEAMPGGGELSVSAGLTPSADRVAVRIADTGVGISAERMKKIFRPFNTSKPTGLGVGLSLAKRILERHGGSISIESRENEGTRVTLQMPVKG